MKLNQKIMLMLLGLAFGNIGNAVTKTTKIERGTKMIANRESKENINDLIKIKNDIKEIKNRQELKELVDIFSNLADTKEVDKQILLFTEDATVQSISNGQLGQKFTRRKQIGEAFSAYLALFETVYHINGQQTLEINENKANGISYSQVVLIKNENGKKIAQTSGVRYNDEYVKIDGKWYIKNRLSNFMWTKTEEIK